MTQPEEMAAFFDLRAAGYDAHMRDEVFDEDEFAQFYGAVAAPIAETADPLRILDLGCGTGLEIEALLQCAPRARITGLDLSSEMLGHLRRRYAGRLGQIDLVRASYLALPFDRPGYDHIVSVMTIHHLLRREKAALYCALRAALKPGGTYIEGDAVTTPHEEARFLAEYHAEMARAPQASGGAYHIDIPFSLDTQRALLLEAGFEDFRLIWQRDPAMTWNAAVYVVTA